MVRLKLSSKMSVLKDVTIKYKSQDEVDIWIAIMKNGICLNADDPVHDGFYYLTQIVITEVNGDKLEVCLQGIKHVALRFGSRTSRDIFYEAVVGDRMGLRAPCPSPASSVTPSPPETSPSTRSRTSTE